MAQVNHERTLGQFQITKTMHDAVVTRFKGGFLNEEHGTISATSDGIEITVLGVKMQAIPRPVLWQGGLDFVEYCFTTRVEDRDEPVVLFYLSHQLEIFRRPGDETPILSLNNRYFREHLWALFMDNLMDPQRHLFEPRAAL